MPRGLATGPDSEQLEGHDLPLEQSHDTVDRPDPGTRAGAPAHGLLPRQRDQDLGQKLGQESNGLAPDDRFRRRKVLSAAGRAGSGGLRELLGEGSDRAADLPLRSFHDAQLGLGDFALLRESGDGRGRFAFGVEGVLDRRTQDLLLPVLFLVRKAAEDEDEPAGGKGRVQ